MGLLGVTFTLQHVVQQTQLDCTRHSATIENFAGNLLCVLPEQAMSCAGLPEGVLKAVKFWDAFKCLDEDQVRQPVCPH